MARKNPKLQENTYYYINFHWVLFLKHFSLSEWGKKKQKTNKFWTTGQGKAPKCSSWILNQDLSNKRSNMILQQIIHRDLRETPGVLQAAEHEHRARTGRCAWGSHSRGGRGRGEDGWGSPGHSSTTQLPPGGTGSCQSQGLLKQWNQKTAVRAKPSAFRSPPWCWQPTKLHGLIFKCLKH